MNILDENFPVNQRQLLRGWRISFRHVGYDIGREGVKDDEIITLLHQMRRPTFFTLDVDFYKSELCHARYCLVYLMVVRKEAAHFVRRVLRHPEFSSEAKRMGTVIRASHSGLKVWRLHAEKAIDFMWT